MVKMPGITGPKFTPQTAPIEHAKTGAAKAKPTESNIGTAYTDTNVGDRRSNQSWDVDVSESAIDNNRAADFAAAQSQPSVGSSPLALQMSVGTDRAAFYAFEDSLPESVYFTAKDVMTDAEQDLYYDGKMSLDEFKKVVSRAQQPMEMETLKTEFYEFGQIYKLMTDEQQALCEAGKMSPLEYTGIQDMIREQMESFESEISSEMGTQVSNFKPAAEYKRSDIVNRLQSGHGHNVSFGGKLMDRQLLSKMIEVMQGKGDGRVSKADVEEILPALLDGDKITTSEENTLLFGLKHCTWTDAAQKELASAIGKEYPNSPIAKFGSLGLSPRFADYEQYHLPEFAGRSADLYGAKMVMNPAEYDTWAAGQMSLAQFNTVLERAMTPCTPQEMRMWSPGGHEDTLAAMTDDEANRYDAGKMSPAEYSNISYRSWEQESPSMKGLTPYQADYKPGFRPFVAQDNVAAPTPGGTPRLDRLPVGVQNLLNQQGLALSDVNVAIVSGDNGLKGYLVSQQAGDTAYLVRPDVVQGQGEWTDAAKALQPQDVEALKTQHNIRPFDYNVAYPKEWPAALTEWVRAADISPDDVTIYPSTSGPGTKFQVQGDKRKGGYSISSWGVQHLDALQWRRY